ASATVTTDINGDYRFIGLSNGNYTVTPSLSGYNFTPPNRAMTINNSNVSGVDFTAELAGGPNQYIISGKVVNAVGNPVSGVNVTLSSSSGGSSVVSVTNSLGEYIFNGVSSGNYRVTPTKAGLRFEPAYRDISVTNADVVGLNFKALRMR
ncbi:MAG: carboxypeptidase regulatory-like domain-containing protein, partial [Thermodesulfovibrionales bacterium]|nr:carboxypeptidase regulatory-like domain-containing protein [Thermodesulfovibrionales bacterium]